MIPEPYGGRLVERHFSGPELERRLGEARELPLLVANEDAVYDAEKIATGAYSPLEGFQGRHDLEAVLEKGRLEDGLPWTIPIVLAPGGAQNDAVLKGVKAGDEVALADLRGTPFAFISVEEIFPIDKTRIAEKAFGTKDPAHPNVADLADVGERAISGKVKILRRLDLPAGELERTPRETRQVFEKKGWKSVAAYQARNPPHTAHEYIQRLTLERDDVDALFVHPVVGKLKKGDYRPEVILRAYQTFVEHYYRPERVLLGSLSITMRYAGPRAALFYAIVRRNYGCSHYIVGRDQAGVGKFYDPYACHRIFDEYDVGVVPLRYRENFHCSVCGGMVSEKVCPHGKETRIETSQTMIRQKLLEGAPLPPEVVRPEVAKVLAGGDVINR